MKIQSKLAELRNVKFCHNKKKKKILCIFDFLLSSSIQPTMTQCHLKPNKEVYLYQDRRKLTISKILQRKQTTTTTTTTYWACRDLQCINKVFAKILTWFYIEKTLDNNNNILAQSGPVVQLILVYICINSMYCQLNN